MVTVKIPATSANLGSGFDCMGLALKIYNTITVEETVDGLKINIMDDTKHFLPADERNLVYKSMQKVFQMVQYQPKGIRINLHNGIPVTRGLGSSSACVAGGLFAANALSGNHLSLDELLLMAAQIEGHPDNSTPAILGGIVTAVLTEDHLHYVKVELDQQLKFAVFIPNFILSTKTARNILPDMIPRNDAVYNVGRAALLAASIISGKYENLSIATEDRLHQQYRKDMIPGMTEIFDFCKVNGARGIYLSGAGPTLIAILDDKYEEFENKAGNYIGSELKDWTVKIIEGDNDGVQVLT